MADAPPPHRHHRARHHGPSAGADRHLADLAEPAQQAVSPSLIVIGEVVALRQQLAWFGEQGQGQEQKATTAGEPGLTEARPESI